ncbi:fibulin-1-like [Dendronephthya gigantea]|uniref:fibulin-1-like n=1 Tax=Dendronephthya gigantea TaxID=151771 RepID=UPI00106A85FF|nr:fibulin-1-like [Dendronephthya gigantea]
MSCIHGHCSNTNGSEICHCDKGFKYNGQACKDNDECLSSPCNPAFSISCNNTPGSYKCICKKGFYSNGTTCLDINECQSHPYCGCNLNREKCVNMEGSCKCACAEEIPSSETECIPIKFMDR